jgi:hypothetical protein
MKKSIFFKLSLSFVLAFYMSNSFAQVVYAKPEEFKELKSRILLVQLLEEDADYVKDMEKKIAKEKKAADKAKAQQELDDTRAFIKNFNTYMKDALTKYWDLNKNIEYKTISEVKALRKAKSNKYTILFYSESSSNKTDAYGFKYFPELSIPTLNYSRIEEGEVKVDYSFFMPATTGKFSYGDIILSVKLIKNHIAEIEKSAKKKYTLKDYAGDEGKNNCSQLKGLPVKIDKVLMHDKTTEADMKSNYTGGKLEFVSGADISKAIEAEEDAVYGFAIPATVLTGSTGGAISVSSARISYYRCFINVKTGKIYSCNGTDMGQFNDRYFRPKEMRSISECATK